MENIELKECPFCGGSAEIDIGQISFYDKGCLAEKDRYELRVSVELRCTACRFSEGRHTAFIGINHITAETKHSVFDSASVKRLVGRWNRRVRDEE